VLSAKTLFNITQMQYIQVIAGRPKTSGLQSHLENIVSHHHHLNKSKIAISLMDKIQYLIIKFLLFFK